MLKQLTEQGPVILVLVTLGGAIVKYLLGQIKSEKKEKAELKQESKDLQTALDNLRDSFTADKIKVVQHMAQSEQLTTISIDSLEKTVERALNLLDRKES